MMPNVFDISDYIIHWFGRKPQEENDLSSLKLQKLLYYCQGHYLAYSDSPMFDSTIEAWEHGPVVREIYTSYKSVVTGATVITPKLLASSKIKLPGDAKNLSAKDKQFIREVIEVRGQFSAWRLREMTHKETPWRETYKNGEKNVISQDLMRTYFSQFIRK